MKLLEEIRNSNKKPKELLVYLSKKVKVDKTLLTDFNNSLKQASPAEKGTLMEVLEYVSKEKPELALPHLNSVIEYLAFDAPRVKWEAARVIGNLASKYPEKAVRAIDALMKNSQDKGTVVRWSAAFALGEILIHHKNIRAKLLPQIKSLLQKEENSGVKNVYLKALRVVEK